MAEFVQMVQTIVGAGALVLVVLLVGLAMPSSKLREFITPLAGVGVAIVCAIYCISPIDIIPEALLGPLGLVDDLGAAAVGVTAATAAWRHMFGSNEVKKP